MQFYVYIFHDKLYFSILLKDNRQTLKIGDFGISRKLTNTQTMPTGETGTLRYMAPEVLRREKYNKSCDIYSYGITLWETITRLRPYSGYEGYQVLFAVCTDGLRPSMNESIENPMKLLIEK